MSIIQIVMQEEKERIDKIIHHLEAELDTLPKGYISEKRIKGTIYYYLQHRENHKMKSVYLKKAEVSTYRSLIAHRKDLEKELKLMKSEKAKLEKALR